MFNVFLNGFILDISIVIGTNCKHLQIQLSLNLFSKYDHIDRISLVLLTITSN